MENTQKVILVLAFFFFFYRQYHFMLPKYVNPYIAHNLFKKQIIHYDTKRGQIEWFQN